VIRYLCVHCKTVVNDDEFMTHHHEYHDNTVLGYTSCGQLVEVKRSATGFFRCPQCFNDEIRDARAFRVSRAHYGFTD